eukprot:7948017-Ditylum_brightwellii.AAC.1
MESWELVAVMLVLLLLMSFAELSFGMAMVLPSPVIVLIVTLVDDRFAGTNLNPLCPTCGAT